MDNMYSILLKSSDKLNTIHTTYDEKSNLSILLKKLEDLRTPNTHNADNGNSTLNHLLEKALNKATLSTPNKQHSLLDWSMVDPFDNTSNEAAGRPSVMLKQSIDDDVLKILKSSDETTWFTLDIIIKKLNEQSQMLDTLVTAVNSNSSSLSSDINGASSPLVEAIRTTSCEQNNSYTASSTHPSNFSSMGNSEIMDKQKEAMSQSSNNIFPETFKSNMQKRQKPNPLDLRPTNEPIAIDLTTTIHSEQMTGGNLAGMGIDSPKSATSAGEPESSPPITTNSSNTTTHREAEVNMILEELDNDPVKQSFHRELFISKFSNDTTVEQITRFIELKGNINSNRFRVIRLTRRNQDISKLHFVSFKIETDDEIADILLGSAFWPQNSTVCNFKRKLNVCRLDPHPNDGNIPASECSISNFRNQRQA